MKNIGVREFRDRATTYLSGSDPIAVSRHGHIIGFYIPVERDNDQAQRALQHLGQTVDRILIETGLSEEELALMIEGRSDAE